MFQASCPPPASVILGLGACEGAFGNGGQSGLVMMVVRRRVHEEDLSSNEAGAHLGSLGLEGNEEASAALSPCSWPGVMESPIP